MNLVEAVLLENIENPRSCFIFPTDVAASRWADHLLRLRGGTVAMNKFIAWDIFKQNSMRSKVQNKTSIPDALRKIFVSRLVSENAEICEQGKTPLFCSLIQTKWAGQAAQFAPWLTKLLPQLGVWFKKTTGLGMEHILSESVGQLAGQLAGEFDADDKDLYNLAKRYAQFLDTYGLFEPAWEAPPFNDTETKYFIFFPESLSDYGEYRELLSATDRVKTVSIANAENLPSDTFFYTNSRSEITEAALYIRALHENEGVSWDSIAVCIPDSENYEPYVLREFANRNIPFVKRSGKPLTDYPAGQFFRSVIDCTSRDFAFSAITGLVLNRNLPWKDSVQIHGLVDFGIKNNCISSWVEVRDGKEQAVNVWEDAFEKPFGGFDISVRHFFNDLKWRLYALRKAGSFSEIRRQYFTFREHFFDMDKCTPETDLILSRCISELMYLVEIEKDFPDVPAVDPFAFFTEYLSDVNYLARQTAAGVTILPYRTAAAAPFDCHIVLGADQNSLSVVFSRLDFMPRSKREKLGIADEDASAVFIDLHKVNSLKRSAFFCSEQTFSGYAIPHSRIGAPSVSRERYASDETLRKKFCEDYYRAENFLYSSLFLADNGTLIKIHKNQKQGFNQWKARRKRPAGSEGKWGVNKTLPELIRSQFAEDPEFPGKYSVSASSLGPYFHCSLKWLFERVLALETVQIETSLMAENISGMVYHAALNLFFSELKKKGELLLPPDYSEHGPAFPAAYRGLLERSVNAVFAGFPALQSYGKPRMSALTARLLTAEKKQFQFQLENCLAGFLSFFAGYRVKGSETSYRAERDSFFLNGKVDCILEDTGEESKIKSKYVIVDFKLKWMPPRSDCTGEGENGLSDFQLPMYMTLAENNEKIEVHTALFYSILDSKPEVIFGAIREVTTNVLIPKKEDAQIMRESERFNSIIGEFNQKAEQFASEIKTGNFSVFGSKYSECNSCNYHRICRTVYKIDREKTTSLGKN
ncbi:MAG: PD-(D/E)XK nuclease family protein [Treponema sp.]|jgi:hypothetical protein|nr:PD-(D/E)XK nuclease family protein [Treponema sp.]